MPITEEQRSQITADLIAVFQERYDNEWIVKLNTNLRPSPLQEIAERRGVSLYEVRKARSRLLQTGIFLEVMRGEFPQPM
jgi:hypothetical protein